MWQDFGEHLKNGTVCIVVEKYYTYNIASSPDVFTRLIQVHQPDILCLQETRLQESHLDSFQILFPGYRPFWSCSKSLKGYSGTAVFVRQGNLQKNDPRESHGLDTNHNGVIDMIGGAKLLRGVVVKDDLSECYFNDEGRVITVEFDRFYLVNCYAPNTAMGRPGTLKDRYDTWEPKMTSYLNSLRTHKPVILAGDLNSGYHPSDVYNYESIIKLKKPRPDQRSFMSTILDNGYFDAFRHFYPGTVRVNESSSIFCLFILCV